MTKEEVKIKKETSIPIINDVIKEAKKLVNEFERLVSDLKAVETEEDAKSWDKKLDAFIDTLKYIDLI